jgi:xylan 1,4-beta-xylosidase
MSSVEVDLGSSLGAVKALHGVNNGPVNYDGSIDVSHYYRELGVPYARLHDPNWPHPREVDIPQIFRDFDAYPDDPVSYDFSRTDRYIQKILDTGAKIVYRLGTSIEHWEPKYYVHPPADFQKWARVCVNVVKHYTEGWAGGMRDAVGHWEIWNEPDLANNNMWTGTFEEYLELYRVASSAIKSACPGVMVGGYAAAYPTGELARVDQFLDYVREHDLPLDFFSWHTYASRPEQYVEAARVVRAALDARGFAGVETHLNEWNYITPDCGPVFTAGFEYERKRVFDLQKSEVGASFVAAVLSLLQDEPVHVANYYDGQPMTLYCGIFDYHGVPQKTYRAFKAFKMLLDCGGRVATVNESADGKLYSLAAVDRKLGKAACLVSRFDGGLDKCTVEFSELPDRKPANAVVLMLDRDRDLEPIIETHIDPANPRVEFVMPRHSVALVRLFPQAGSG